MVPVDAVIKQNPPAQTTAVIGVPFTYTITAPHMGLLDSTGTTFQYFPSPNDVDIYPISNIVITDDLTQGNTAALSYVTNTAYLVDKSGNRTKLNGGNPLTPGVNSNAWLDAHPVSLTQSRLSDNTKHLVFSYEKNPDLVTGVPAGSHIEIDLTVVLDDNKTANFPTNKFTNTADNWYDKTIVIKNPDGTTKSSTPMTNLHGWFYTTPAMTIVAPDLWVTKTSTVSVLNIGATAPFTITTVNRGSSDAWDVTITDDIPAGMCQFDPRPSLTAQIYNGTTPVSTLSPNIDYSLSWNGPTASACQLILTTKETSAAKIAPNQSLVIKYNNMLDLGTPAGLTLTNVAGATRWFGAVDTYTGRHQYPDAPNNILTNGTPGIDDFQDAWPITSASQGYYFLKSVEDRTTGVSPTKVAFPGDTLRYTLQIENDTLPPLNGISVTDVLPAGVFDLNTLAVYTPGTNLPTGATYNADKTTGTVSISNLNLGSNEKYQLQFEVTLVSSLGGGTVVSNQAILTGTDTQTPPVKWSGVSDDPHDANGPALLSNSGDITSVTIQAPDVLSKESSQSTATIGQTFKYFIKVPATPVKMPLYDVKVMDNLGATGANLVYVGASAHLASLTQSWPALSNSRTATNLILYDPTLGIDIPANDQAIIEVTVQLDNDTIPITNLAGLQINNTANYTYNKLNNTPATQGPGKAGTTLSPMTVVEPHLTAAKTVSYASPAGKSITAPAAPGDVLRYTVTVTNDGSSEAYDADVMDFLPSNVALVPGSATAQINGVPVSGFIHDSRRPGQRSRGLGQPE